MRWVRFDDNGRAGFGIHEGDAIRPVEGDPFTGYEAGARLIPAAGLRLLAPVAPPILYAAGMNYESHVEEAIALLGSKAPDRVRRQTKPDVGYRAVSAIVGPDEPIVIPADSSGVIQYEGELAVVIGRKARNVSREDALSCVLGYTICNDVSERNWQGEDRTIWRSKNCDSFKPLGPWIETEAPLESMRTRVAVNGVLKTEFDTGKMIFGIETYIAAITRYITLQPGDVIMMGTDYPCGDMVDGDVVEIEITGIGTLRNPVVMERAAAG